MFDTLTLDDLLTLQAQLGQEHTAIHNKLMDEDLRPLIEPLSVEWEVLAAKQTEITETADAVCAEIQKRLAEGHIDA